jgi:ubiquinone/menaquinone biosynthesis C-methylase UbiE
MRYLPVLCIKILAWKITACQFKESEMKQSMSQITPADAGEPKATSHRIFAAYYERQSRSGSERSFMEPLRKEIIGQAHGLVLEVGAGTGLNFPFYNPEQVVRVEAVDPDSAMLRYARERVKTTRVPITLTQAPAEALPYADETFDSAVATLVFCSVTDPLRGLNEIHRVLKPGGTLLLMEHVRAQGAIARLLQNMITPVNKRVAGNCHWNRDTERTVVAAGFEIQERRDLGGLLLPKIMLRAGKA